jgi:hypothetical protein
MVVEKISVMKNVMKNGRMMTRDKSNSRMIYE